MPYFQCGKDSDQNVFYIDNLAKDKKNEMLFFIHGWYQNSREAFDPLINHFESRYRILALDLPGHGASYKHRTGEYSLLSAFRCAEDLLFRLTSPKDSVSVIGHSLGSFIAAKLALLHPKKISRAVYISPVFSFKPYEKKMALWSKLPLWLWPLFMRSMAFFQLFPYGDRKYLFTSSEEKLPSIMEYYEMKTANHPHFAAQSYLRSFLGQDILKFLPQISIPTLVIYGGRDKTTPYEEKLAKNYLMHTEIEIIPQAGHNVQLSHSHAVIEKIENFLARHKGKKNFWQKLLS
ncbi:MAG: alpha/beta hydrolase [Leptospiraceae bacterium]|nr:alpha/beta hydrolase [Leptospiraceae bacterium]MDW8306722.1 alpha/beta hydrolase [Leptospiraceae bacterium]